MHKCLCSTRALDAFVKDFAGLHLHPQRAQLYFQQSRTFRTTTSLRQTKTAGIGSVDDGFIPFEVTRRLKRSTAQDVVVQEGVTTPAQSAETATSSVDVQDRNVNAEWHADIEINGDVIATQREKDNQEDNSETSLAPAGVGSTPEWVKPAAQKPLSRKQRVLRKAEVTSKAISEARKTRKERRLAEGKYKGSRVHADARNIPMAAKQIMPEQLGQDVDSNQVQTVLAKLDQELGGPSIIKAQQKSAEKLAAKSIEKKRKAQLTAAKKQDDKRKATEEAEAQRMRSMEPWQRDKAALQEKFGDKSWAPRKRLSPDSLEGIRALHGSDPETYNTAMLSQHFQITPEAIRRILKSKWKPSPEEIEKRMERWEARGVKKWQEMSELGMKPPKKWRMMGVANPKLEMRKKWENTQAEKPVNQKTGKKERWRNLNQKPVDLDTMPTVSLADRL